MLRKSLIATCLFALVTVTGAGPAQAQDPADRSVYFTFSQPVALPGVTLPAGKYLFKLMNSQVTRTVVQVFDADRTKLHGTFFTIAASRNDRPNDPEVRFLEAPANQPNAIGSWWYPGMSTGWEFVYSRREATQLAQSAKRPVLTTTQDVSGDAVRTAPLARVDPQGQQVDVTPQENPSPSAVAGGTQRGEIARQAATPAPAQATTPAPAAPRPAQDVPAMQPARDELPKTASSAPLMVLLGVLALCAGLGFGLRYRSE